MMWMGMAQSISHSLIYLSGRPTMPRFDLINLIISETEAKKFEFHTRKPPFFTSLFDCLQANLGDNAELVLYDLTAPSGPVVADIRNGRISNGAAGFGKELLSQKNGIWPFQEYAKTYNAIHTTSSGSVLRCSAMCIYDESALPIGCICINQDITETLEVERSLHNLNKYHGAGLSSYDSTNISSVLDSLINDALAHQDVPPEQMDRAQRIEVVRYLNQHGAFLVTKAGERIANLLGISKYTLYSYLDTVRA